MNAHSLTATGRNSNTARHSYGRDLEKESQSNLDLAQRINIACRSGHDSVNRTIVSRFSLGLQDHRLYREGLLSFAFVYKAFEDEWATLLSSESTSIDPRVRSTLQRLYSTPLLRTPQFFKDLKYYYGSEPFSIEVPTTVQQISYVNHIQKVVAEKPHVLIAYAFNLYMGLFAGGKILGYQMSKAKGFFPERYGMTEEERVVAGMNIFNFDVEKGTENRLRDSFKGALHDLESTLTEEEKNDIIEESKLIYANHILLVHELDRQCAQIVASRAFGATNQRFLNDRTKFLSFLAILVFFLVGRHFINCL